MKTIFNGKMRAIGAWALGAVLLIMTGGSCTPQPAPAATGPSSTTTLAASTATATPLPTPTIPEDWLVFCEPDAECAFGYPADADIKAGKSRLGTYTIRLQFRMPDVIGYQGMVIHIVPITDSFSMNHILTQLYESSPQDLSLNEWLAQIEPTTVGSQTCFRTSCAEGSSDFWIVIPHEDRVYIAAPVHDIAATCVDPQTLELFYQVLETFIASEEPAD